MSKLISAKNLVKTYFIGEENEFNALNDIVNNGKSAKEVVYDLMNRETKGESLFIR